MADFKFDKIGFQIDGKDQFLVSGEFHYFRVPAYDWKRRMELFKEAGGRRTDLSGRQHPWAGSPTRSLRRSDMLH